MSLRSIRLLAIPALWFSVVFLGGAALEEWSAPPSPRLALHCGRTLVTDESPSVLRSQSVRVALALDEEWRNRVPDPDGLEARRTLTKAGSLFRGVGIYFLPVRVLEFDSPDHLSTVRDLLDEVESTVPATDFDIVILLTAQRRSTPQDGYAAVGGRHAVVTHHPEEPILDALVMAHEVAHLFGAHHGCDKPGRGGLMNRAGFEGWDLICQCTRRVLEENANRFHTSQQ